MSLRKARALSKKWFSKVRRAARAIIGKKMRASKVPRVPVPPSKNPYAATGPTYRQGPRPTLTDTLEQLGRGSISTFGSDIQDLLGEGKDVLKSLHGDFFKERGYEVGSASRSAFKTFYDVNNNGTYSGLNRAWDPEEDAFSYSLRQRTTEIIDVLVSKDTLPPMQLQSKVERLYRETDTLSSRGAFGTIADPYVRRPGVGLIVDVIAQADKEIVIDLYQLQNRTILDALEQKVRDNPGLKVSVRLSLPDAGTRGQKGFDILGPNLLSLERLRRVKEELGASGDIELFVQDRKSHQKVMVTDKFGIIGSFNQTAPAGFDVNQAGSNYEVVRKLQTREYSQELYRDKGLTPTPQEEILISSSDKLFRQLQVSVGNRDALRKDPTAQLRLNQGQIIGAAETYDHLRSTLDLMKGDRRSSELRSNEGSANKQFYGILNQVFLLYHEDTLFNEMLHGEMGKFDTPSSVRGPIMKGIQAELLDLVIGNRAFLAVDNRNYTEHVLGPMYERTEAIFKGTGIPTNSLEDLVGHIGFDRGNPLTSLMSRVEEQIGHDAIAKGFTESYARQLLAMTSGNIRLTTVPMQHSKQYLVVENDINGSPQASGGDLLKAESFYSGSANLGPFSMHAPEWGMDPLEVERTNREFGLAFMLGKTGNGPHVLTNDELREELELSRQSFSKDWRTLTRTAMGSPVEDRPMSPWYEDRVDKVRLGELHARLTELTTTLGMGEVTYTYGGKSGTERTGLSLTLDARQLAGFGEGFESIKGQGPKFRWDYTTLSGGLGADEGYVLDITRGRLISRSLIHNSTASSMNIRKEDISHGIGQDVLLGRAEALGNKFVSVAPNKAVVMNPIGTTLSLVSTLLLESTNRLLVWGPEQYLSHLGEGERRTLIERYLDSFIPGAAKSTLIEEAGKDDRSNITNLLDTLTRRFLAETNGMLTGEVYGALERARAWSPAESRDRTFLKPIVDAITPLLSSMAYGYSMEEHLEYGLEGKSLSEARAAVPLSTEELVRRRVQRATDYVRGGNNSGLVDILMPLLDSSPDFRLAVVQATVAQSNPSYTEILSSGINAMSGALMEPFLLSAQVGQYSGPQGWYRLPMFSVTKQYQEVLQRLEGTPYEVLASQALAIPRAFSPYSSVGIPGLHRQIAGGTNSPSTSLDTGLTVFGQMGMAVDTIMHHRINSSMGVGFSTTREDILASGLSDSAKKRALAIFDESGAAKLPGDYIAGGDELLTYLFGGKGKVAQIPQRLKNTQGQRGMGTLSHALSEALAGRGDFLSTARSYRRELQQKLEDKLVKANPTWTPNQVQAQVDSVMPEQDVVLAAAFDMSVRGVMGGEQVAIMEAYKRALMELGLDLEDFEEGGLGHELIRVRAISSDVMSTGMKGFTASPTYALVQMAGMYSDYFYANPAHGGMEGNVRTTTKKVKASMLGVDWTRDDGSGMELARAQDIVMFDTSLQKVVVISHDTGSITNHSLNDLTKGDLHNLKEVIDDRGQRSVLEAMVENKGREANRSSISTITTTGWSRPGEDSKEYLLSMKALPGGGRNQLFYELTYIQAILPGGGRRVDSGTSLFKGVAVFLTSSFFDDVAHNREADNILGRIGGEDIFGLVNPSNLKSFSLEHGGSLLRGGKAQEVLASLSERDAAVAMLLAFGSNYMEGVDKGALSGALYEALRQMPGVYKETALQIGLREGPTAKALLSSLDKSWNPVSMFSLMDISGDAMLSSLKGGAGIKDALGELLSKGTESKQYLNVDNSQERQAATILTALDITRQLLRDERVSPGDVSMRADVMDQLMSIVGLTDKPEQGIAHAMISGLSQSVASVYLKMDLSYSSSKEPLGTKGTGALQNADLVRPFTQIAKDFTTGGDLSKLRVVLANMLVSTAVTETATSIIRHILPGEDLPIRSALDPQLFTPLAMFNNLGVYGSGMEDISGLKGIYKEYGTSVQKALEERIKVLVLDNTHDKELVAHVPYTTELVQGGDIPNIGKEISTLLFEAADPAEQIRNILGSNWKEEYRTFLSSIQDVGRRYELLASKPFAVGEAEAIVAEMGHERGIFYLPTVMFDPMPSESGRIIARIDDSSPGISFFIPGAEDLRTYGVQYGSYTDELVRSTLTLASPFSPGTVMNNIFSTLSKAKATQTSSVEFTPEEVKALQWYYITAYGITERIAEAAVGTRVKQEARVLGGVGTFAASLAIPQGAALLPEELMRSSGDVADSLRRKRLEEVTRLITAGNGDKRSLRLARAEKEALIEGMGEKGTTLLSTIHKDIEYLTKNPLQQRDYAIARLWTVMDAEHVANLTGKMAMASAAEASRLEKEVRDYTRMRLGIEQVPVPQEEVRSYRDIVDPREGNEGNYFAVELGEQLMRASIGVQESIVERTINPPLAYEELAPRTETLLSYTVGSEHYVVKEQARAAQSALDTNLRGELQRAITSRSAGLWQGSIRGRVETYRLDKTLFQGLGMSESRELLADSVLRAKGSVDQLLTALSKVDTAYGYGPEEKALVASGRTELETLSSELGILHSTKHEWTSMDSPIARMESLQVSLNTSDVLMATVFRPAPFGSTELQRQQFSAISGIAHLNEYLVGQEMSPLDEKRNKSLGLIPALSAITSGLGDFDGDPYIVIFSKMGSAMNDKQRLEDKVKANTLRIGMIRRQASASGGEFLDEYWMAVDDYKVANDNIRKRITRIDDEMRTLRDELVQTYDPLLRKEVASYMGISQSFFSEYQGDSGPISMEVLPTYLQQGRGLFGGIEGVAYKNSLMAIHATMEQIHATEDFKGTLKSIQAGTSLTEALAPYTVDASTILQGISDDRFKALLTENPTLRHDFLERMVTSIQAQPTMDTSASLMYGAAALSSSEVALSNYSKYMGMGSGTSMSPTVYDMLTKTLGVAGGDILGKSYNTLVGTLFRDSPLIALSHVLSSNTAMDGMREYYRGIVNADDATPYSQLVEDRVNEIHEGARRAESLQGFMKSAQQLLRDSIKFKGDTDVLGELQRAHAEYEKHIALGDEDSARSILNDMAGKLGPGPGLRSYMQLNTLVTDSSKAIYNRPLGDITDNDISYLNREYKVESHEALGKLAQELRDRFGDVGAQLELSAGDVVRYKVARDMRATITAFRYELGSKDNQPFLETVWRGMRGFLGITSDVEKGIDDRFQADPTLAHDIGAALSTDATEWWGRASNKNKALMLALVDEGRKQTDPLFGMVGEGLEKFTSWEALRKKATSLGAGMSHSISNIPTDVMEADVSIALMNAAMSNKLSPEAASMYVNTWGEYLGEGSKLRDVLSQTEGGKGFIDLDHGQKGTHYRIIDIAGARPRIGQAGEPLGPGESYRKFRVGSQEYDSPLAYVEKALEATSTGQRSNFLRDIANAINNQVQQSSSISLDNTILNALSSSLTDEEVHNATLSRLQEQKVQQGMSIPDAKHEAMREAKDPIHQEETRRIKGKEMMEASAPIVSAALRTQATSNISSRTLTSTRAGAAEASHARHSMEMHEAVGRMHDMNDMVLGAGLTLLGSLMATGSINENTIGQVVGGTISVLGYSQMGRSGLGAVMGQAFRARMARAESKGSEDEGEWVRRWVGREVGFYMGAAVLAPAVMGGAEKLLSKFSPLRLDRPMDIDKFKSWKAAANTIGGAVLSSVLGMVGSVIGGEVAVQGTNLIPSLGVVERFVRNMADTEFRRQDMIAERLAQVGEGTVMDEYGDPLVATIEVSYVMDNPTTDFTAYPMGEANYSAGDNWEVNMVG